MTNPETDTRLTPAQRRGLEWLPSDGSWRTRPGRLSAALHSLGLRREGLVESEWGDFGPRGGREQRLRLTAAGVALKQELQSLATSREAA